MVILQRTCITQGWASTSTFARACAVMVIYSALVSHTLRYYTCIRWASSESLQQKITLERVRRQPHQHVAQIYMSEKGGLWCSKFQCKTLTARSHGWVRRWRSMRGARSQEPPGSGQIYVGILGVMFKSLNTQCTTLVAPASQTRKHPWIYL